MHHPWRLGGYWLVVFLSANLLGNNFVYVWNEMRNTLLKTRKLFGGVPATFDLTGLFLIADSIAIIVAPILLVAIGLYMELDPIPIVLRELVSEYPKRETLTWLIIQLCRGYLVVICLFGVCGLLCVIPLGLITLIDVIQNLLQLVNDKLE